jgi:hypothetical protein
MDDAAIVWLRDGERSFAEEDDKLAVLGDAVLENPVLEDCQLEELGREEPTTVELCGELGVGSRKGSSTTLSLLSYEPFHTAGNPNRSVCAPIRRRNGCLIVHFL